MSVSRRKVKAMSPQAQQIMNAKNEFELAFDQIKNIIFKAMGLAPWKDGGKGDKKEIVQLQNYKRLIMATLKQKDRDTKMRYIREHCDPYLRMFMAYRDSVLEEDMTFLADPDEEITITTGKSKNAVLPISKVYMYLQSNDEDGQTDLEAKLLFCWKHLAGVDSADRKALEAICEQYEIEENQSVKNTINNIVGSVKGSMSALDPGNGQEPTLENIAPIVEGVLGNQGLQQGMADLAKGLMTGEMDIPTLMRHVKGSAQMHAAPQQNDEDDKGKGEMEEID